MSSSTSNNPLSDSSVQNSDSSASPIRDVPSLRFLPHTSSSLPPLTSSAAVSPISLSSIRIAGQTPRTRNTPASGCLPPTAVSIDPDTPAKHQRLVVTWDQLMHSPLSVSRLRLISIVLFALLLLVSVAYFSCNSTPSHTHGGTGIDTIDRELQLHVKVPQQLMQCPPCTPKECVITQPALTEKPCTCPAPPEPLPCKPVEPVAAAAVPPPPIPASSLSKSRASIQRVELFGNPDANAKDSMGEIYAVAGRGVRSRKGDQYKLCSFTNVCVQNDKLLFKWSGDANQKNLWLNDWREKCWKAQQWLQPEICSCFHPAFLPDFLSEEQTKLIQSSTATTPYQPKHMWAIHKWVSAHHIAHWAQKLVIWQALYQHAPFIDSKLATIDPSSPGAPRPLPPLEGILFHDSDLPMSEHEAVIFRATLEAIQVKGAHTLSASNVFSQQQDQFLVWADTLRKQKVAFDAALAQPTNPRPAASDMISCYDRVSFTPHYGIFSTHADDTIEFRESVLSSVGLPPSQRCPPKRAVLLYRHNRRIANQQAVLEMLKNEFQLDAEYVTIDESTPSKDQIQLFATTGLMLSSHSSQLINMVFSPPGASVVEIAPEFYNADFSEYAHGMGLFFQYALGGQVVNGVDQPGHVACVQHLSQCDGASHCVLEKRWGCHNTEYPNKNLNFHANLTAVRIALKNSIQHLNWLCGGRW